MDREDLFQILISGDFVPPIRLSFPGAVAAARDGDLKPLLRLHKRSRSIQGGEARPLSASPTLYAATTCEEARLPWSRTAALSERPALAAAAAGAIPESAFRPFDRVTSLASDYIDLCLRWPQSPVSPVPGPGPLPDVPTLLIEGEDDLRTPVESARAVASQLPRSKLVVVPGVGHSALAQSSPGCAGRAYDAFFAGRNVVDRCPRPPRERPPVPPPVALRAVSPPRPGAGTAGRAAVAAGLTLADVREDADATLIRGNGRRLGGGLRAGRYALTSGGTLDLRGVSFVGGLRVSGRVERFASPRQRGTIRLSGPRGARGVLKIRGRRLTGRLGGRRVTARMPALLGL